MNLLKWNCIIPGPKGTVWEEGHYKLTMEFPQDYPLKPPKCHFKPTLPHPNIYPSGTVCLSILNEEEDWKPAITISQILQGIQKLIKEEPNLNSPANEDPFKMYKNNRDKYDKMAREFAHRQRLK